MVRQSDQRPKETPAATHREKVRCWVNKGAEMAVVSEGGRTDPTAMTISIAKDLLRHPVWSVRQLKYY